MLLCVFRIFSCSELRAWHTGLPKGMNFVQGSTWEAKSVNHFAVHLKQIIVNQQYLNLKKRYPFIKNCSKFCKVFLSIVGSSVQFSSVAQSWPTLCDPMNRSMPGLPVHHYLLEFTQTHIHRVGDAIQPSHPPSFHSLPAPNSSQHQGLFQWVNSSHEMDKELEFQPQHQPEVI